MSEKAFHLRDLRARIRRDGTQVEVTFIGTHDESCAITMDAGRFNALTVRLLQIFRSAKLNSGFLSADEAAPAQLESAPAMLLARQVGAFVAETGEAVVRVTPSAGPSLDLVLTPALVQDLLTALGSSRHAPSSPSTH